MSLAIDVLEPSALLIVCQVLDGALLTRLRGAVAGTECNTVTGLRQEPHDT